MENLEITVEELQDILENNKPIKIIDNKASGAQR